MPILNLMRFLSDGWPARIRQGSRQTAVLACLPLVLLGGVAGQSAAQGYELQPGDTLRMNIPGVPGADRVVQIDIDGRAGFPFVGDIAAAGLTLAELRETIRVTSAGREVVFLAGDGTRQDVLLGDVEVFVAIEAYRDVTVTGSVADAGPVPFVPGMTVRRAIAGAGGVGVIAEQGMTAWTAMRLLGELEGAAVTEAQLVAEIWRLESLLAEEIQPMPDDVTEAISMRLGPDFQAQVKDQVDLLLELSESDNRQLEARLDMSEQRIEYLEKTLSEYEVALETQTAQLENVEKLFERGLIANDRLSDTRNATLLTSARLLSTEAQLSDARISRIDLVERLEGDLTENRASLMRERADARIRLEESRARMASLRSQVELAGLSAMTSSDEIPHPQITLFRGSGDDVVELTVQPDDLVRPGDVLEVTLDQSAMMQ